MQKVGLACTLCLSIFMIAIAAVRIVHLRDETGSIYSTWGVYWFVVPALVGPVLASAATLRALFVAKAPRDRDAAAAAAAAVIAAAAVRGDRRGDGLHDSACGGGGGGGGGVVAWWSARGLAGSLFRDTISRSATDEGKHIAAKRVPVAPAPRLERWFGSSSSSSGKPRPPQCDGRESSGGQKRGGVDVHVPRGSLTDLLAFVRGSSSGEQHELQSKVMAAAPSPTAIRRKESTGCDSV